MQKFTIRDIENMCGIKAHTLRIWEQRYDLFTAKRKSSTHRYYDNEDLKKLLRIAFLYHTGLKVSKIAALSQTQISELIREVKTAGIKHDVFVLQLLEAAVDFDEHRFKTILEECISAIGVEECVIKVCYPFLQKTGLLWMTNNVIPAQEHFSSYIIQHKIIAETDKLDGALLKGRSIVLFTPDGEHHELPLLFINYMLRKYGWRTIYLGANVQRQAVKEVIQKNEIDLLYFHVLTNFTRFDIDDYLEQTCKAFRDKKLFASGAAIQVAQRNFVNLQLLKSDDAIYRFIKDK